MDEQLKAFLEGINALKSGQQEMQKRLRRVWRICREAKKGPRIKEQVEERIEEVAGNFNLVSQRVEYLEKKLLACGNKDNERKFAPASPVPVLASPKSVKLSTYDGKTNWEVYKTQFSTISGANGWTEVVKACQLTASLRGEAAEILQTLPDTERLNLNSLYEPPSIPLWIFGSARNTPNTTHTCK
ncbi:uncharacterized protein TNCV_3390401 [Trichonephila clavipes]|nr:uncharacterized protein TNCV_3390401 [Trichonephila clavipes]